MMRPPHFQNAAAAREYLERTRWPAGPVCPHCRAVPMGRLESRVEARSKLRAGVYKCESCRRQCTVTVGTIFQDSRIPLHKWLLAIDLMCSGEEGISALRLQRELWGDKGSYRTASFMCRRIRWAMTQWPMSRAVKRKAH